MAKQIGPIRLKGTIAGISFYTSVSDGDLARQKGGPAKGRIAVDPAYAALRANNKDFATACFASQTLRRSFGKVVSDAVDIRRHPRLTQVFLRVLKADPSKPKGLRTVREDAVHLLEGFDFNSRYALRQLFQAPYTATADPEQRVLELTVPPFVSSEALLVPVDTTHFRIFSIGTAVDFAGATFISSHSESDLMPWDTTLTTALHHRHLLHEGSNKSLFLALGVCFYRFSDGAFYALEGATVPLSIVKAIGVV